VQLAVIGMTCSHCVVSVSEELRRLEGVKDVQIELVAGGSSKVTVLSDRALQSNEVAAAIDEAGYELADLPR
jgi:copper chaperone CopZ